MHNDSLAYRFIVQYMGKDVIWKVPNISSWKDYMIQLALPYKQREIEGGIFVYEWLSRLLNMQVHIWSS